MLMHHAITDLVVFNNYYNYFKLKGVQLNPCTPPALAIQIYLVKISAFVSI